MILQQLHRFMLLLLLLLSLVYCNDDKGIEVVVVNKYHTLDNYVVIGAIIMNEGMKKTVSTTAFKTLTEIAEIDAISSSSSSSSNSSLQLLQKNIPILLSQWPSIYTTPCPHFKRKNKVDRGHSFSHYQILLDFIYYDYDVINAVNNKEVKGIYTSTSYSSTSSIFTAYENGTMYKDGILFNDNDIIIIFEDNIDIAISNLNDIIIDELKNMNTDIIFFGWCYNKNKNNHIPLCSHAYGITRRGAKEVIANYNLCGQAIDEQIAHMIKNKYLTYRLVDTSKYTDKFHSHYSKDLGIIQKKRSHY